MSELNVLIPTLTLSFRSFTTTLQCQQILQQKQFKLTKSKACSIFLRMSSLFSIIQNRSVIFPSIFEAMARKKKQRKKDIKNTHIREEATFQTMIIRIIFMIISDMARNDKEAAFLIGTILLTLVGIPSTKPLRIWTN